jgi:hypothetical protein
LTAIAVSTSEIDLAWVAATSDVGVTSYLVERCQDVGCSSFEPFGAATDTGLSDSGLAAGTTYSYRVRAADAAGNLGPYSSTATATTQAPDTQAPTAPTALGATTVSATQIDLTWTAAGDDVGVTGYLVERCQGADCSDFAQVGTSTTTSFSSTGLTSGTTYTFRVQAQDAAGNTGAFSSTVQAMTSVVPAFVQGTFVSPSTPLNAVTAAFTDAQAAGDLNVVILGWRNSSSLVISISDTAGNSYALAAGPTRLFRTATQSIYYARNIAAAPAGNAVTVRLAPAAPLADLRVLEYSGLDGTSPVDVVASGADFSGSTAATPSVVTTNAFDLIVGGTYAAAPAGAAGLGFTLRLDTPNGNLAEDLVTAAAGPYDTTIGLTASGWWIMQMVAFQARQAR